MWGGKFAELPWCYDVECINALYIVSVDGEWIFASGASSSSIVHQYVDGAVSVYGEGYEIFQLRRIEYITFNCGCIASGNYYFIGRGAGFFSREVTCNNVCAGCGE